MFDKIQHIGYLTSDLEAAVGWFERSFGAVNAGGGPLSPSYAVPSGGRNAYLRFGQAEAEIIEPAGQVSRWQQGPGYAPRRLRGGEHRAGGGAVEGARLRLRQRRAFRQRLRPPGFLPGRRDHQRNAGASDATRAELRKRPAPDGGRVGVGARSGAHRPRGLLGTETWKRPLTGTCSGSPASHVGGGASRRGGRNAFVNFGQVQVELIEPGDPSVIPEGVHEMGPRGLRGGRHPHLYARVPASRPSASSPTRLLPTPSASKCSTSTPTPASARGCT